MNVSLTPKLEAFVKAKVRSGLYNNASEVLREALRLLQARDRAESEQLRQLRAALIAGKRAGRPGRSISARSLQNSMPNQESARDPCRVFLRPAARA